MNVEIFEHIFLKKLIMIVVLLFICASFVISQDIFKEICKIPDFVMMREEQHSKHVQPLYVIYPRFERFIINTLDSKNVLLTKNTSELCALFSSLLSDPSVREITLPMTAATLCMCDKMIRKVNTVDDLRAKCLNHYYSWKEMQEIFLACKVLKIPNEMQNILLLAVIAKIHPASNFKALDPELNGHIIKNVSSEPLKSMYIKGYCYTHSTFLPENVLDTKNAMISLQAINCSRSNVYEFKSPCGAFIYKFTWNHERRWGFLLIQSSGMVLLETDFRDKECSQIDIGQLNDNVCLILQSQKKSYTVFKSLIINYIDSYKKALQNLEQKLTENPLVYITLGGYIKSCTESFPMDYKHAEFVWNAFDNKFRNINNH